jgi:hypothetical protein
MIHRTHYLMNDRRCHNRITLLMFLKLKLHFKINVNIMPLKQKRKLKNFQT